MEIASALAKLQVEINEEKSRIVDLGMFKDVRSRNIWNTKNAGKPAFNVRRVGNTRSERYGDVLCGRLGGRTYLTHRIAFMDEGTLAGVRGRSHRW